MLLSIKVGWHVYKLAPDVNENDVEPILRRLNPLRHTFKTLMLKSYHTEVSTSELEQSGYNLILMLEAEEYCYLVQIPCLMQKASSWVLPA